MPIYEYYSEKTGETKEVIHPVNERPKVLDSNGNEMTKLISTSFTVVMGKNNKDSTKTRRK